MRCNVIGALIVANTGEVRGYIEDRREERAIPTERRSCVKSWRQEAWQVWRMAASALRGSWGMSEMDRARAGHDETHHRFPNFLTSLLSQHVSYFFMVP